MKNNFIVINIDNYITIDNCINNVIIFVDYNIFGGFIHGENSINS
ncbi:hypothetical protein [Clostridium neonatale]|uniref:Uncharacterized protein n=1 Tax=Clostridium neonatale TaxID=137838 RepID=A0AA86JID6_9CLOT|nr:hypothetical protein CNEO_41360 [Clostridium neonatale]CAG9714540.1 hypothetical protein CNEO_90178 [Clostridium neonatale]CAG9718331.1 hypothetical protein CNEO_700012 [Clostridium neonatale]CAI3198370.1 hypothetical protein CNEO2_10257 [Clostridium neonatale]CAI3205993.1 hypothetical protein CNEO2_40029 [Clostridium neonatale]